MPSPSTAPSPRDLVRARDTELGVERTVRRLVAESDPARYHVADGKATVDSYGVPLPAKPVEQIADKVTPTIKPTAQKDA